VSFGDVVRARSRRRPSETCPPSKIRVSFWVPAVGAPSGGRRTEGMGRSDVSAKRAVPERSFSTARRRRRVLGKPGSPNTTLRSADMPASFGAASRTLSARDSVPLFGSGARCGTTRSRIGEHRPRRKTDGDAVAPTYGEGDRARARASDRDSLLSARGPEPSGTDRGRRRARRHAGHGRRVGARQRGGRAGVAGHIERFRNLDDLLSGVVKVPTMGARSARSCRACSPETAIAVTTWRPTVHRQGTLRSVSADRRAASSRMNGSVVAGPDRHRLPTSGSACWSDLSRWVLSVPVRGDG
jgi:hypothetical protein